MVLPPVIFSAGYSLKRRKFFQYIDLIAFFGIIGTIVNFILIALGAYAYNRIHIFHFNPSSSITTTTTTTMVTWISSLFYQQYHIQANHVQAQDIFQLSLAEALIFSAVLTGIILHMDIH